MNKRFTAGAVAAVATAALVVIAPTGAATAVPGQSVEYTVVAEDGVAADAAIAAIQAAGGTVVGRTDEVGLFRVVTDRADFAQRATASAALTGAAEKKAIGRRPTFDRVEQEHLLPGAQARGGVAHRAARMDPLDDRLWGLEMIRADKARRIEPGDRRVTVGVLDTGLDASHPDLAPNFDWSLSRNFAQDIPEIDGECEVASCLDPVGTDDDGHGTHVAGTIGAAVNGVGVSGVAPNVSLVELKGGQDSGYFFLDPVVNALVHAGRSGIDVVNMSFYVDPWLYNCTGNPADSAEEQAAQRAIIKAMKRALNFAHRRGVTLIGSLGNNAEDLGAPRNDTGSPNYGGEPRERVIDNDSCWDLPVEGPHTIGVSALGPTGEKADYSNYGTEQISVAAPGGWFRSGLGTPSYRTYANMILSTYPRAIAEKEGLIDENGDIVPGNEELIFKDCTAKGDCGYYTYLQGTSMASPHASGVTALIVSRHGEVERRGGMTMDPDLVEQHLYRTAAEHACPEPRLVSYVPVGRPQEWDAYCAGGVNFNGFYGYGIIDAFAAVTKPVQPWKQP